MPPPGYRCQCPVPQVLSNLLHQSGVVRAACANTGFLSHILSKVKNYHSASNQDTQATCHNIHGL